MTQLEYIGEDFRLQYAHISTMSDMYNVQHIGGNAQIIGTLVPYENGKAWMENIQYLGEGGIICDTLGRECEDKTWPTVPGQLE